MRRTDGARDPGRAPESSPTTASVRRRLREQAHRFQRSDAGPASFIRFVVVGAVANGVYVAGFWAAGPTLGIQVANLWFSLLSAALANELHRRRSFHATGRVGWWTAQWEGGGLAIVGLAATALALAIADALLPSASTAVHTMIIVAVTGAVGLVRFLLLRTWFAPKPRDV